MTRGERRSIERAVRRYGGVITGCIDLGEYASAWITLGEIEGEMRDQRLSFAAALQYLQFEKCPICNPPKHQGGIAQ